MRSHQNLRLAESRLCSKGANKLFKNNYKKKKNGKRTKVEEYKCKSGIEMRKINRLFMCLEDLMLKYVFKEFANYQINQLLVVLYKCLSK